MINKIIKPKSEFSRNILTLMTGTTIAQAIPISISPILTRLYSPEDFGVFALYLSITMVFGVIASARYEQAIMLPKKDEDAINIFALGLIITTTLTVLLFLVVIVFRHSITNMLGNDEIGKWLILIPASVFLIGLFNLLTYYNNRKKLYRDIAKATVFKSVILSMVQLVVGYFKSGATGLVSGQLLAQTAGNIRLFNAVIKDKVLLSNVNKSNMFSLAKKYKNFPLYAMWGELLVSLSQNIVNILISHVYSIVTLGYYSFIQRVLGLPSSLIGGAVAQVFYQEAMSEKHKTGSINLTFNLTLKKLIFIGLPFFGILFIYVEDIFIIIFGEAWSVAGEYAKILIPFFFIKLIVSPITHVYNIYDKLSYELVWRGVVFIGTILIFFISNMYEWKFTSFLHVFSVFMILMYSMSFYIIKNIIVT